MAAPRSVRLTPNGVRSNPLSTRHLFAPDDAVMGVDERVKCAMVGPGYRGEGPGDCSPGPSLGLEGLDLVGLGLT